MYQMVKHIRLTQKGSPNIVLFYRVFSFVMGSMKIPNPGRTFKTCSIRKRIAIAIPSSVAK